jgi:hypothetical protein
MIDSSISRLFGNVPMVHPYEIALTLNLLGPAN